jgi:hypothetical protein
MGSFRSGAARPHGAQGASRTTATERNPLGKVMNECTEVDHDDSEALVLPIIASAASRRLTREAATTFSSGRLVVLPHLDHDRLAEHAGLKLEKQDHPAPSRDRLDDAQMT